MELDFTEQILAKIINTEWKKNDSRILVVACSATESTNATEVVKNGLIAFRYRKLGKENKFNS